MRGETEGRLDLASPQHSAPTFPWCGTEFIKWYNFKLKNRSKERGGVKAGGGGRSSGKSKCPCLISESNLEVAPKNEPRRRPVMKAPCRERGRLMAPAGGI